MTRRKDSSNTRDALIEAGLYLFGTKGFEATSTRAIAERAGANVASIAYYFGSKAGLRRACSEAIATRIGSVIAPFDAAPVPDTPEAARAEMRAALRAFVGFIAGTPAAKNIVTFILRALSEQDDTADFFFERIFLPRHQRYCALWSIATGQPADADEVKLTVFALIGQVIYFRLAEPIVTQRMGWSAFGRDEVGALTDTLLENLDACLERSRK